MRQFRRFFKLLKRNSFAGISLKESMKKLWELGFDLFVENLMVNFFGGVSFEREFSYNQIIGADT